MYQETQSNSLTVPKAKDVAAYTSYRKFWKKETNMGVYNALLNGITLNVIAEMFSISVTEVQSIITNTNFMIKLQEYLTGIVLANNAAKVIASEDVFNKLWTKVKENIDDIPPEICLKELTRMLPKRSGAINIINPENVKISQPAKPGELEDDFGFNGLPDEPKE